MTDLWILVLGIGFFAVAAAFVVFCDVIIGPDEDVATGDTDVGGAADDVTAPTVSR